jgi:hypothetical protein
MQGKRKGREGRAAVVVSVAVTGGAPAGAVSSVAATGETERVAGVKWG